MIEPMNRIALDEVLKHMLGADALIEAQELYRMVDTATTTAYRQGALDTMENMVPVVQDAVEEGRKAGVEEGNREGHDAGWRQGYLQGVARARTAPDVADVIVKAIIDTDPEQDEQDTELFLEGSARAVADEPATMPVPDGFTADDTPVPFFYEGDSGDEDTYCTACGEYRKSCVGCE